MNGSKNNGSTGHQPVFAITTDSRGNITETNKAFIELSGYSSSDLNGKHISQLHHADMPSAITTQIWDTLKSSNPWMGGLKLKKADGTAFWLNTTVSSASTQPGNLQWILSQLSDQDAAGIEALYRKIRAGKKSVKDGLLKRWMRKVQDAPIGRRITLGTTGLVALVSLGLTMEALFATNNLVDKESTDTLHRYAGIVQTSIDSQARNAISIATTLATMPTVKEAFVKQDRTHLLSQFKGSFEQLKNEYGFGQFQFHTKHSHSFLRVHKPAKYGDDLSGFRATVVKTIAEGKPVGGLEEGKAGIGIRGVVPITVGGQTIGSLELGKAFDQGFLNGFKSAHNVDLAFYQLKGDQLNKIGSTFGDTEIVRAEDALPILQGAEQIGDRKISNTPYKVLYSSLSDFSGKPIGVLAIGLDQSRSIELITEKRNLLVAAGVFASLLSVAVAFLIARSISTPINAAVKVSSSIAEGKYNNAIKINHHDETGTLLKTMGQMQAQLAYKIHQEHETSEANARVKTALDYIATNVTVSDAKGRLIFMNNASIDLFSRIGQKQYSGRPFNPEDLLGKSLAKDFFQDAKLREIFSQQTSQTHEADFQLEDWEFKLFIHPVRDEKGQYRGRVTEWQDVTSERTSEREIEAIVSAANQGNLSKRAELNGKTGFFKLLATNLNELLDGIDNVFTEIDGSMKRVASGDLTKTIDQHYAGTFESLKQSVNSTIINLQGMVGELRKSAGEISGSAGEISSSNEELTSRTERQSSSLESTAAALEEITGTVGHNAENAHLATDLAVQAQKVSKQGVQVVHEAIDAMGSINDSSAKIEEIISVIDEIAFQTNLLALNAAVEAARAGDMGRGFAVVANEVRALAGRSSDAAKEIKVLITDSVEKVHNGTKLVNRTGSALDEITTSIEKVNSIMSEIASANQEQSIGISQINHSVTQLDDATNQNTGLAKQTYQIAESLKVKAHEMDQLIGQFETEQTGSQFGSQNDFLRAV